LNQQPTSSFQKPDDPWDVAGTYELFMARWSRPVAEAFIHWLDPLPQQHWLDVGCGTGALSGQILQLAAPADILAIDPSSSFIAYAQPRYADDRLKFQVGDALMLPVENDSVDIAVSGLALNFFPEPSTALAEMARVVSLGGKVAIYVWDYSNQMQFLRTFWDAAVKLEPAANELDEGLRFPLCRPDRLKALFERMGFLAVEVQAIDVPTVFKDFDDYWSPFLGGTGPAPAYVASISDDQRAALKKLLAESLPTKADGSIILTARAWAVQGQV
jgi:SAM-dependent methyltransferase